MKIVFKIGTSTLAYPNGRLNIRSIESIVKVLSDIKNQGHQLIIVSSGAIGMGVGRLMLSGKPEEMAMKQAAAAVGQSELMKTYDRLFSLHNHTVGQILLTKEDLEVKDRLHNFQSTVAALLRLDVIPILNENDSVATDEISVGDNDTLGAIVAVKTRADMLVALSDIKGLYTADPQENPEAQMLRIVEVITPEIEALAGTTHNKLGRGGMATKVQAAKIVTAEGCDMVIMNGKNPEQLYELLEGQPVGTRFPACRTL
ncbi:MAG: glutamate 5-kinase [Eubacteriales bacterium]